MRPSWAFQASLEGPGAERDDLRPMGLSGYTWKALVHSLSLGHREALGHMVGIRHYLVLQGSLSRVFWIKVSCLLKPGVPVRQVPYFFRLTQAWGILESHIQERL